MENRAQIIQKVHDKLKDACFELKQLSLAGQGEQVQQLEEISLQLYLLIGDISKGEASHENLQRDIALRTPPSLFR